MKPSTNDTDAGVGRQVPISRRAALRAGALTTVAATILGLAPMSAVAHAERAPSIVTPGVGTDADLAAWIVYQHIIDGTGAGPGHCCQGVTLW